MCICISDYDGSWYGPFFAVWTPSECPDVGDFPKKSLPDCKDQCALDVNCNRIEYSPSTMQCIFRKCPSNAPVPTRKVGDYQSYEYKGKYLTAFTYTLFLKRMFYRVLKNNEKKTR